MSQAIDPKLIDFTHPGPTGYPDALAAEDTRDALICAAQDNGVKVVSFPQHMYIPRKDWKEVEELGKRNKTRAIDFLDRFTNQDPSHECVTHAAGAGWVSARNRMRRLLVGPPVVGQIKPESRTSASVWPSCLSLYAEAQPRRWGGSNVRQVLEIFARRGAIPDKIQPRDWGFKHTLIGTSGRGNACQSGGQWVSVSEFPDGWQETAKFFKPEEVIFPETFEELMCLVLGGPEAMGLSVQVGGRGHSIPYQLTDVAQELIGYPDSYDVIRWDRFRSYRMGGAYAILSTTVPDDWDHPAG